MHSLLLPEAKLVDHIDGNGLNNQRANLRAATPSQNARNRKTYGKPKGVSFKRIPQHYEAYITLGSFKTESEAAAAYNRAASLLFGEQAALNPETGKATRGPNYGRLEPLTV